MSCFRAFYKKCCFAEFSRIPTCFAALSGSFNPPRMRAWRDSVADSAELAVPWHKKSPGKAPVERRSRCGGWVISSERLWR